VKHNLRNSFIFATFALTCLQAGVGCSANDTGTPLGSSGGTFPAAAGTGTTAGTSSFTSPMGGSDAGGTPASSFGGAFATGGTFGSAGDTTGTAGTAGSGTGGTAGSGGAATAGSDAGGTGGTAATVDFPAGCPMPSATAHAADKLTKTCWKASASACSLGNDSGLVNPPSNVLDADLMTRFATGDKMVASKMFLFDVDMGKAVMINGVSTATITATDIPPQIEVDVSTDGTTWTPVACGTNSPNADISFAPVSARYVRLVQHGTADAWWSMVDFNVYRSGADDTCGAGDTATACTSTGMAFPDTCCGASHKL
jgi:hypothetical protein